MAQTVIQNSILTIFERVNLANDLISDFATSNVFVGIGVEAPYSANDSLVTVPNQSTDYMNSVWRSLIALKKITAADLAPMIPRIDWTSGVTYSMYDDQVDMFTTVQYLPTNGTVNVSNSRTLVGTNTTFTSQYSSGEYLYLPGDDEFVAPQLRQVIDVFSNTSMNVNTAFTGNFVSNTAFLVSNTSPYYANTFYVRNSYDQVFKCLYSPGTPSNAMPQLALGGDLPEDPYIVTSDGYFWKYMYAIPSGNKQLFFSPFWMPVYTDPTVIASSVNGRLDVVLVEQGGTGYNGNVPSNSATIITVVGDGSGANLTAIVNANGAITGINVLNGGSGYTEATLVVSGGTTGAGAVLRAIIGPPGGHGSNPYQELGSTTMMVSMELQGTEGGTIPTGASIGTGVFEFRQVSIIKDTLLQPSGNTASNLNYSAVTTVTVQTLPAGQFFNIDETVYQGQTLANSTFSATVVYWDEVDSILWLNNLAGDFSPQTPIVGTVQTTPVTAFVLTPPEIDPYSGDILYVNNVLPVIRGTNQTEQIRVILSF